MKKDIINTNQLVKNLFSKKLQTNPDHIGKFQVIEIDAETEDVLVALGMSKERGDELFEICKAATKKTGSIVAAAEIASKECLHPNELFFIATIVYQCAAKILLDAINKRKK